MTANLANCKRLFKLSGWNGANYTWRLHKPNGVSVLLSTNEVEADDEGNNYIIVKIKDIEDLLSKEKP